MWKKLPFSSLVNLSSDFPCLSQQLSSSSTSTALQRSFSRYLNIGSDLYKFPSSNVSKMWSPYRLFLRLHLYHILALSLVIVRIGIQVSSWANLQTDYFPFARDELNLPGASLGTQEATIFAAQLPVYFRVDDPKVYHNRSLLKITTLFSRCP